MEYEILETVCLSNWKDDQNRSEADGAEAILYRINGKASADFSTWLAKGDPGIDDEKERYTTGYWIRTGKLIFPGIAIWFFMKKIRR